MGNKKPKALNSQGYVLLLDVTLAVILFTSLFSVVHTEYFNEREPLAKVGIQKTLDDSLSLLDKRDALETLDPALMKSLLDSTLPGNLDWRLTLTGYTYQGGVFNADWNLTVGNAVTVLDTKSVNQAKRLFFTVSSNRVNKYYLARLEAWPK